MLSSSSEYLKALREGRYLLFLGWTDFIIQKFNKNAEELNSDDAVNFLIFEWLNNGFSEDDAKKLAILYAVYDLESKPLQGKLDYSLKSITVALFLCMVFQEYDLIDLFYSKTQLTPHEINQLMKGVVELLDPLVYKSSLEKMQAVFFQWVEVSDKKVVDDVRQKINAITRPRYLLEDYILHLERVKLEHDELYIARLSLAKRFLGYLYEQTELTVTVTEEIAKYANAIREMHPSKGEEARLDNISPPTVMDSSWRWVTGFGMGFFKIVLLKKPLGEFISGMDKKPEI